MKWLFRFFYGCLVLASVCVMGAVWYFDGCLPDSFTVTQGQSVCVGRLVQGSAAADGAVPVTALPAGSQYQARLSLMGLFPVKEVTVAVTEQTTVMVCGTPFGMKLYTDGVLVVGLEDVATAMGRMNPAASAGVCVGDVIVAVDGQTVSDSRTLGKRIAACEGGRVTLRLRRDGVEFDATFTPVRPVGEGGYRAGMWVRDSAAGVGTLTFYDPATGVFAGLGHGVYDVDTGEEMPMATGEVVPARIFGIKKGAAGTPGEVKGAFEPGTLGVLARNGSDGLYGNLTVYPTGTVSLPVAHRQQVEEGTAQILTTVDGTTPRYYDVTIQRVRYGGAGDGRHMVVQVTDPELLALTGGIVQGMSGSPIIQNGRLVGAVTHVLVDDPTRGYGIFAEQMLETAQRIATTPQKEAS